MSNVEHESRDGQHRIHVVKGKLFFTVMVNDEGLVVDLERDDGTDAVEEVASVRWRDFADEHEGGGA
jgi:hypothetical protein